VAIYTFKVEQLPLQNSFKIMHFPFIWHLLALFVFYFLCFAVNHFPKLLKRPGPFSTCEKSPGAAQNAIKVKKHWKVVI